MSIFSNTVGSYKSQCDPNTRQQLVPFTLELFDNDNKNILCLMMDRCYTMFDDWTMTLPNNMHNIVGSTIQNVEHKIIE